MREGSTWREWLYKTRKIHSRRQEGGEEVQKWEGGQHLAKDNTRKERGLLTEDMTRKRPKRDGGSSPRRVKHERTREMG